MKTTSIETKLKRILLARKVLWSALFILVAAAILAPIVFYLTKPKASRFVVPAYDRFDRQSTTYWQDRVQWNIDSVRQESIGEEQKEEKLRFLISNDLREAERVETIYDRTMAIYHIALTLARNDAAVNIDATIRAMDQDNLAFSVRARILVSQALMYLRLKNGPTARVAIMEYGQLMVSEDLKLDSKMNDLSFCGAVTVYACMEDTSALNDLFRKQLSYTPRTNRNQKMKAYRIIAGEQARVGFGRDAVDTLRRIDDPVEESRTSQLIISRIARPVKIAPDEPELSPPETEGPWGPLANPVTARHIVDEVLKYVAEHRSVDRQLRVLKGIAGSRLMCDPEIHRLLTDAIRDFKGLSNGVKGPTLRLLEEPESELIRASLKMPPLPPEKAKVADPALDDWNSPIGPIAVEVEDLDPEEIRAAIHRQVIRIQTTTARMYMIGQRRREAAKVLRTALETTRKVVQPTDRTTDMLAIANLQIAAADIAGALDTLREIGLPNDDEPSKRFTEGQLSEIARLRTVARSFDEALETIRHIGSETTRNEDYAFLAQERIRIHRLDDAAETLDLMTPGRSRDDLFHRLSIARGGGKEHYEALDLSFPEDSVEDAQKARCCEKLIWAGLSKTAETPARKIADPTIRSGILARIAREYMLCARAYRDDNPEHQSIRRDLFDYAVQVAGDISAAPSRAQVLESIITDSVHFVRTDGRSDSVHRLIDQTMELCRTMDATPSAKAELMSRLISSLIALETPDAAETAWPLIRRESQTEIYDRVWASIEEAVQYLNESQSDRQVVAAMVNLARQMGQIGKVRNAQLLLREAKNMIAVHPEPGETISMLLSLIPVHAKLGDDESVRAVYRDAFVVASESFAVGPGDNIPATLQWRKRDMEIDRIVVSQIEQNFLGEAVDFANRIGEVVIKDRLLQAVTYIHLDRKEFEAAENAAGKIDHEELSSIEDVLFMERLRKTEK